MQISTNTKKFFSYFGQALNYTIYAGATVIIAIMLVGFVPQMEGTEVRRLATNQAIKLRAEDYPQPIHTVGGWSMRFQVTKDVETYSPTADHIAQSDLDDLDWVNFHSKGISLNTASKANLQAAKTSLALVLAHDDSSMIPNFAKPLASVQSNLISLQPSQFGEALSVKGQPLRWAQESNTLKMQKASFDFMCALKRPSIDALRSKLTPKLPNSYVAYRESGDVMQRAALYKDYIAKASAQFGVRESLIYAIIQTESGFYSRVVSPAKAMGLMQLLPTTAKAMHKYVYGRSVNLSFEQVTNPEMNITLGVAFLKLMMTQYFQGIENPRSREYCTVASYNMGPGRLFPFFGGSKATAIANINAMTPEQVFERLVTGLPYRETRAYLNHVSNREQFYRNM